ncbi:sigma factor G inhibitor Gin [Thermoactinomyces mirandus]|uniref:Carnitine--CoA ligase n=1 Tax=Thermoactinomyces mirandus TaxID=2756294 RepID=A0A7W1XV82_9BACL|nr:sigma factor G inhibitor Gin [Thermoactinomyces mirandus]MBA4603899.1 carnitine--CoA ligase [Thermoactinomyces mirandus]
MLEKQICMVCQQKRNNGLRILNNYICDACEKEIVECDSRQILYGYFVWKLRALIDTDKEQELHGS